MRERLSMRIGGCIAVSFFLLLALGPAPCLAVDPGIPPQAPARVVKLKVIESLGVDKLSDKDLEAITSPMGKVVFERIFHPDEINKSTMDLLDYIIALSKWRERPQKDLPLCFVPVPAPESQPYLYELLVLWLSMADSEPEKFLVYVLDGSPLVYEDYYSYENPMRYWIDPVVGLYEVEKVGDPNFPILRYRRGPVTSWVQGDYYARGRWSQVSFLLLISAYGEGRTHGGGPECYRSGMTPAHPSTWIDILPSSR